MMQILRPVLILVGKDILLEWRSRDLVVSVLVFSLLIVVVFNFALNVTPQRVTGDHLGDLCFRGNIGHEPFIR